MKKLFILSLLIWLSATFVAPAQNVFAKRSACTASKNNICLNDSNVELTVSSADATSSVYLKKGGTVKVMGSEASCIQGVERVTCASISKYGDKTVYSVIVKFEKKSSGTKRCPVVRSVDTNYSNNGTIVLSSIKYVRCASIVQNR